MTAWSSDFYVGTDLDSDFQTINDLFGTSDAINPDPSFVPSASFHKNSDLSRIRIGLPRCTLKLSALPDEFKELLREFWEAEISTPLYWRIPINQLDDNGAMIWRTFLTTSYYPTSGEDEQGGYTLGFVIELVMLVIQEEIA